MISVIIPTLNEENTIAAVVKFSFQADGVDEVLVIDDRSFDQTVTEAKSAGAKILTSTKLGKGASMRDGVLCAKNEIIVFLDGDIDPYPPNSIHLLTQPILDGEADFVKGTFARQAGRVTELVAKPLLSILFPELSEFRQPLSGMIASKKSLLLAIDFQDDYGVDIGLLIDVYQTGARIKEINIGEINNKMKPWQELGKMSREVAQTILTKAVKYPNKLFSLEDVESFQVIREQMDFALRQKAREFNKAVIFDMDNTILHGRFIDTCSGIFGFKEKLMQYRTNEEDHISLTKNIAYLLRGLDISQLLAVVDNIPIVGDISPIVKELHQRGYIVGIISDSYSFVTNHIMQKIDADFSLANELEFSKSIATGEVKIPSFFFHNEESLCRHKLCKTNALMSVIKDYQISMKNVITVGDSLNDLCMIKNAGIGVAFCSSNELLNYHADKVISQKSFADLLEYAN